jgi:hypothetical protein
VSVAVVELETAAPRDCLGAKLTVCNMDQLEAAVRYRVPANVLTTLSFHHNNMVFLDVRLSFDSNSFTTLRAIIATQGA